MNFPQIPDRLKNKQNPSEISRGRWPAGKPPGKRGTPLPAKIHLWLCPLLGIDMSPALISCVPGQTLVVTCAVQDRLGGTYGRILDFSFGSRTDNGHEMTL